MLPPSVWNLIFRFFATAANHYYRTHGGDTQHYHAGAEIWVCSNEDHEPQKVRKAAATLSWFQRRSQCFRRPLNQFFERRYVVTQPLTTVATCSSTPHGYVPFLLHMLPSKLRERV